MTDMMKLQDGSCVIGTAAVGAQGEEPDITEAAAGAIGGAFAYWLGFKVGKNPYDLRICVGSDPRLSADDLKIGLFKGITMFGAEGYDAGIASTPGMFMSAVMPQLEFDGAVMVTAGSCSPDMNGFRFFTGEGELGEDDAAAIMKRASKYNFVGEYYEERQTNAMQMYAAYLRQMISFGLRDVQGGLNGVHVVVDAGNGSGGFFAKDVLEAMGADVSGSMMLEPDGTFPGRRPDAETGEAAAALRKAVTDNHADLGVLFDTDACNIVAIGSDGSIMDREDILRTAEEQAADAGFYSPDDGAFLAAQLAVRAARLKAGK